MLIAGWHLCRVSYCNWRRSTRLITRQTTYLIRTWQVLPVGKKPPNFWVGFRLFRLISVDGWTRPARSRCCFSEMMILHHILDCQILSNDGFVHHMPWVGSPCENLQFFREPAPRRAFFATIGTFHLRDGFCQQKRLARFLESLSYRTWSHQRW